jgi:hypothetical protein
MKHSENRMARVVKVYRASEQPKEREYWMTKTPAERLTALEEIRNEYHANDESERRLQRVYRIVKQS